MLEYENEMFLSALQEDGLTIVAKGLRLENVFLNLLKVLNYAFVSSAFFLQIISQEFGVR